MYSREMLDSLDMSSFCKKWRWLLSWQDDHVVMTGDPDMHAKNLKNTCSILEYMPPSSYPRALDLGCGAGEAEGLRRLGYQVTGLTLGPLNVRFSEEKFGLKLVYGDMHDLPFPAESFDCVVTKHSFEHCFAPILVVIEIWYVLRTGGRWMLYQPNANNDVGFDWGHPTILTARQREALFTKFGFKLLRNNDVFSVCEKLPLSALGDSSAIGIHEMRRRMDAD